jgi:hypothetical protein
VSTDEALLRVKRNGGEVGEGGFGSSVGGAVLKESLLEETGDVLIGDRGYSLY